MYKPSALITGITGQDGTWLCAQLVNMGYTVHGMVRQIPRIPTTYIPHTGDVTCYDSVRRAIWESQPNEIYNLAAMSHVGMSYQYPELTYQVTGIGASNVFRAAWEYMQQANRFVKVYQASSSEMFGKVEGDTLLNENSPFNPISPYAVAKVMAHKSAMMYRQMGLPVWCGILFNHESEFRPPSFLTTKAAKAAARLEQLQLGNLEAVRDWGYAPEYTKGMWQMLQTDIPDTYVLATGEGHTVEEFVEEVYRCAGADYRNYVVINRELKRPLEAGPLIGDYSKAYLNFSWVPTTGFAALARRLVEYFQKK